MSQPTCTARTKRGTACRSWALPNRDVCISHAEDLRAKVEAARRQGGTAAPKLRILTGRRLRLDSPAAVVRFTSGVIQDCLGGMVEVEVARTVLYGLSVQLKAIELAQRADVEQALAEVRLLVAEARRRGA